MMLTSTPAGLWAASYLFSNLAHCIRINIGKEGLVQDDLKYGEEKEVKTLLEKGVGLYHDRIIYEATDTYNLEGVASAVKKSVNDMAEGFAKSLERPVEELQAFFEAYLNIHMVCVEEKENESFLITVNNALDAAELEKSFPSSIKSNPILELFNGDERGKNEKIKSSFLVSGSNESRKLNWVLTDKSERGIKNLQSIASGGAGNVYKAEEKAAKYYAVIRADGDNMGATVKRIRDEGEYLDFSKNCFIYGCKTAEIVLRYGGIPIYVGGDDLLCIAPLKSRFEDADHTFLEMIKDIRTAFKEVFPDGPDLSFGVQIQYVKAPLYEALNESGRLLFGVAKANKPGALAINLRKHSGQTAEVTIKALDDENRGEALLQKTDELIMRHATENTLKSVGSHVGNFATLLDLAGKKGSEYVTHYFDNVFDNGVSPEMRKYVNEISNLAQLLNGECQGDGLSDKLGSYIRLIKFFSEKVDREEETL